MQRERGDPMTEEMRCGTGHSLYVVFAGADTVAVSGKPQTWRIAGDSGNEKIHAFCPTCGAPSHLTFAANPEITAIHAGSLDTPASFHPKVITFGSRALDWGRHDPGLTVLENGPPT